LAYTVAVVVVVAAAAAAVVVVVDVPSRLERHGLI